MTALFRLALTMMVAAASGIVLKKLRLPSGMLVGAIIGSVVLNITTPLAYMPYFGKFLAQMITGTFIGCGMSRDRLRTLPGIAGPFVFVMVGLAAANTLAGFLVWKLAGLDFVTAMLSTMPGGMTDTPLIAAEMGADVGCVAVLQFIRMLLSVGVIPSLIAVLTPGSQEDDGATAQPAAPDPGKSSKGQARFLWVALLAVSLLGALLGRQSGIPAGVLVGALCGAAAVKLILPETSLPLWVKRFAQILAGAYIGCVMQREQLLALGKSSILPGIIIVVVYLVCSIGTGFLIHRIFKRGHRESMLLATPGGASDMALTAAEMGVFSTDLVFMQILRMVVVVSVFPQLIQLVACKLGVV